MSQSSVDQVAAAISQFEQSTNFKDFRKFHIAQAVSFKERLQRHVHPETGRMLAKATIHSRLMALKALLIWLAGRPGYRSKISYADADYFNVSANDERIAKAIRTRPVPSAASAARPRPCCRRSWRRAFPSISLLVPVFEHRVAIVTEWIGELVAQGFARTIHSSRPQRLHRLPTAVSRP
jgi:hypothetical protein